MKCCYCNFNILGKTKRQKTLNFLNHLKKVHPEKDKDESVFYFKKIDLNYLIKQYINGESTNDLYKKYKIDIKSFNRILEKNNIKRTNSQAHKTEIYTKKYEETNLKKYGVKNISNLDWVKEKKKQTFIKNYGVENNFCRKEIRLKNENFRKSYKFKECLLKAREKYLITMIEKYGVRNVSQVEEVKNKISKTKKEILSNFSIEKKTEMTKQAREARMKNGCISNLEKEVLFLLNSSGFSFSSNIKVGKYFFDIVDLKNKILIEINGDYWHCNPEIYLENDVVFGGKTAKSIWEKDYIKFLEAKNNNFKVFYIWENFFRILKRNKKEYILINKIKELYNESFESCFYRNNN